MSECDLSATYDMPDWAVKITLAEQECVEYAKTILGDNNKVALSVGTGASHLYSELYPQFQSIDGITIIDEEINVAQLKERQYNIPYRILKNNKYDVGVINAVLAPEYGLIVDVNLKMYGCCQHHWEEYFRYIVSKLASDGILLSHSTGFGCYAGFRTGELSLDELSSLLPYGFLLDTLPSPGRPEFCIIVIRRDHG